MGDGAVSFFGSTTGSSGLKLLGGMQVYNYASSASNAEGGLRWYTSTGGNITAHMYLDNSGKVLVGKSSSNYAAEGIELRPNEVLITKNGLNPLSVRGSGDGSYISINNAGTSVGSIGVTGTNNVFISGTATNHAGLTFATNSALPTNEGAINDSTMHFGQNGNNFKDIWFTGKLRQSGVQRVALGGAVNGNATVSFTVNHTAMSTFHVRCGFNHYGLLAYGCALDKVFANGQGGISSLTATQDHQTSLGGSWAVTRVDEDTVTVSKTAGSYPGGGYYYIIVEGANLL